MTDDLQNATVANRLNVLHDKLNQRRAELVKLNQKKREIFVNTEIEDVQNEIKKILLEICQLEASAQRNGSPHLQFARSILFNAATSTAILGFRERVFF